jgi:hypothetical protein
MLQRHCFLSGCRHGCVIWSWSSSTGSCSLVGGGGWWFCLVLSCNRRLDHDLYLHCGSGRWRCSGRGQEFLNYDLDLCCQRGLRRFGSDRCGGLSCRRQRDICIKIFYILLPRSTRAVLDKSCQLHQGNIVKVCLTRLHCLSLCHNRPCQER